MNLRDHDLFTRLIRTRPLLMAAMLYLTGCILGYALNVSAWLLAVALLLPVGLFFAMRKGSGKQIAAAVLLLAFLPLGMLRFDCLWSKTEPLPEKKAAVLTGRICRVPDWNPETERAICVLEDFSIDGIPQTGRIRLYFRGDIAQLQAVKLGQSISCDAHIWRAEEATNPGQFNFSNYLRLNGLRGYATAEIETSSLTPPSYVFSDWPERIRLVLGKRIDRLFPENNALARAFLLGDRSGLSDEERESYSTSGAAHLLAISGMHVSVLAAAVSLLLGRFMGRRSAFFITFAALFAYGCLIGFSASLVRAILMFALFTSAPLLGRYSDGPTRIAAAMLIYLLIRPVAILESSFVLSYGASAGIIFLSPPLKRLMHLEGILSKRPGVNLRSIFTQKLPKWIAQSLLVTIAAQLAILPAVVHFFGRQPVWSLLVNLIAVPLAMLAYVLSMAAVIIGLAPLAAVPDFLFGLLARCVQFFSRLPFASLQAARFPLWLTFLCAAACFLASDLSAIRKRIRSFLPLFVILAIFISNGCAMLTTRGCSLVFLDAGEADCAVIRTEGKVYLIDTGDAYTPAADYLSAMDYDLEGVFLSHCHTDHSGGLANILEVCIPKRIYISTNWNRYEIDEDVAAAIEYAAGQGAEIVTLSAGDEIVLSEGTLLEVLSPAAGFPGNSANDDSLILCVKYGDCSAVFTGDAPSGVSGGKVQDSDILKVPHHGSGDGLSAALLREISPSVAVIPVGYNNYGHPSAATLELLDAAEIPVYRTDIHGAVTISMHRDGSVQVRPHQTSEDGNGLE